MNNASSNVKNNYMPQQQMQQQPQQQQVNVNQFASPSQMANINNMMHSTPPASMSQFGEIPRQFAMKQQQQQQQPQQMSINSSAYANQFAQSNANVNTNHNTNPITNNCNNNNNNTAQYNEFSVQGATYNAPLNSMAAPYQPSHLQLRPPYVPSQH